MTFTELAAKRRSIRKFSQRKVEKDLVEQILGVTLTAPSSKNTRSTRIAVTEDPEILEYISNMRLRGSSFVKDAPIAFIIMGDDMETDLWRENAAISATILQFAAESLGLGSCWVHVNGRPYDHEQPDGTTASEYLHEKVPALQPYRILCVIAAGYPEITHKPHDLAVDPEKIMFL